MVGVVVVSKFFTHENKDKFGGMVDYMDRKEAIKNENISFNIETIELDDVEKKICSSINKTGSTDINILSKDKKLRNMIYYRYGLFDKKNKITRYDANYIFKRYFNKYNEFSLESIDKVFKQVHKNKNRNPIELEKEKKRIITRILKLEKLGYITRLQNDKYRITEKAENEIKNFSGFQFTSYDVNKIFKLVRGTNCLDSMKMKLANEFNLETKEGKNDFKYIINRINDNIKCGFIKKNKGELEITEAGLLEEDKIKNPHKKFIEEKLKELQLKSDEFKRKKDIVDEKYSIIDELEYSGIVDYMDRNKAKNDNEKSDIGLFTNCKDRLNDEEKSSLKELFNRSQENGGILWHDVVSFDNRWLEKHGIYDSKNKILDDRKLKDVIRASVNEMFIKENLYGTAVWCGDIHYNTDNIHVHISTVELKPTRTRGKRKKKSIFAMKSKVVNSILKNNEQYKKINDIIRKDIIENKRNRKSLDDVKLRGLFLQVYKDLPKDRRQWQYNYNTLNNVRPLIDKMTEIYIKKYSLNDFLKLKKELDKQEKNLKEAYGRSTGSYYDNKLKDLQVRMGNAILKEIKDYDYNIQHKEYKNNLRSCIVSLRLKKIETLMRNEYEHMKNQQHYKELQNEIERSQ